MLGREGLTLCIIPASARAMYAPREYPSGNLLDCMDDAPKKKKNATEEANFIAAPVMLHEKHVAIEYMLIEVPRKPMVEKFGNRAEERRDCAGLDVGTDTSLCQALSWPERHSEWASTFLVIARLGLWVILLEHGEQSDYIGILRDVNRINDASGLRW